MSKIEKQQEKVTNLLKLISENPDLEILPIVYCQYCGKKLEVPTFMEGG